MNTEKMKHKSGCCICGKPLRYEEKGSYRICAVCGKTYESNAVCEDGHFVCDSCHASGSADLLSFLRDCREPDPIRLFLQAAGLSGVHMHGPEHHILVPCVLLTAFRNNGGTLAYADAMEEAVKRGRQVPGGFCGFWGVCGAAAGAGIYASIVTDSSPLNAEAWGIPMRVTAACLERLAEIGGPRCCKRTGRIAIETAAAFTEKQFGIFMPLSRESCTFCGGNAECLRERCPYYG